MNISTLAQHLVYLIKYTLETVHTCHERDEDTRQLSLAMQLLVGELLESDAPTNYLNTSAQTDGDTINMKQHLYDLLEQQCSANLSSCQAADDHPFRFGVSIKPHYKTLAYALAEQVLLRVSSDSCTIAYNDTILAKAASSIHLLNASDTVESKIVTAIDAYKSIWMESCKDSTNEELDHRAKQAMHDLLFSELQLKEYAAFLGLQSTTGSILMQNYTENGVPLTMLVLPPSLATCIDTFTCRHTTTSTSRRKPLPPNQLTVGAKALSKHSHRDVSQSFWGICTGTEHSKNVAANIALAKILSGTVWRNLHQLPHQIVAYEIRNKEGYGARWTLDTRAAISVDRIDDDNRNDIYATHKQWQFRGLLEPQMIDGHEQGWRH